MSRLAEDIEFLQRVADAAGLVIYPQSANQTFPWAGHASVTAETLASYCEQLSVLRLAPREYRLIDYEAIWLLRAAHQLVLHRADGDTAKTERFQKLGEYFRSLIETDLVNARKSEGVIA